MIFNLEVAGVSNVGKIRTNNEDNLFFNGTILPMYNAGTEKVLKEITDTKMQKCYAIFDGMGGESQGEKASFYATEQLKENMKNILLCSPEDFLLHTCFEMNDKICIEQQNEKCYMGTTAAILYLHNDNIHICNIGDSRIYRIQNDQLEQLSKDHVIQMNGRMKPALTQNLGIPESEMKIEPYIASFRGKIGDKFLICSDGLTDMIYADNLLEILKKEETAEETVQELLNTALENGGKDNVTVILVKLK